MEQKKELAKIALAALVLASTATVNAENSQAFIASGTYLAAGCPAHGCQSSDAPAASNKVENRPMATASSATLTDAQLLGMLNEQGRKIFLGLDAEGKALAIQLASQDIYKDKNLAVKEAQRRINENRSQMNK